MRPVRPPVLSLTKAARGPSSRWCRGSRKRRSGYHVSVQSLCSSPRVFNDFSPLDIACRYCINSRVPSEQGAPGTIKGPSSLSCGYYCYAIPEHVTRRGDEMRGEDMRPIWYSVYKKGEGDTKTPMEPINEKRKRDTGEGGRSLTKLRNTRRCYSFNLLFCICISPFFLLLLLLFASCYSARRAPRGFFFFFWC